MSITKTTRTIRPNTSVPFFRDVAKAAVGSGTYPAFDAANATLNDLIDAGKLTHVASTSDDGLTDIRNWTFADLETLSAVETALTLNLAVEYQQYRLANDFTILTYTDVEQRKNALAFGGINQPYRVTTTYTFPEGETYIDTFTTSLEAYEHYGKIVDLYIDGNKVVIIHQYLNSEDQTTNPYLEMFYAAQLVEKNVTRTVNYELV